ncbi:MAG: Phosphate transport system permease protein PstA [Myxococcaceae bacterium]|nr:Phosphate transport system permease protein PstA [Myxococcaceae bacterium]
MTAKLDIRRPKGGSSYALREKLFIAACLFAVSLPVLLLFALFARLFVDGLPRLSWTFLSSYPSRRAELAGILPAAVGTLYLIILTAAIALPIGVGAAIYLEEYGKKSKLAGLIEVNIANLAGVPSIIYGLLGLGLFVRALGLGRSLLAGAATLALLVLPVVVVTTREALRTVPLATREACLALGATRWQTIRQVVLPQALPGIMTGAILAVSRALGETAPLVVVGALAYVPFLPDSVFAQFGALPIQIFNWVSRPQQAFLINAAAGIVVLLLMMLVLNLTAIIIRDRMQARLARAH